MSESTTAKVFLAGKTELRDGQTGLVFSADYNDDANKEWAKYTPSLNLTMTVLNEVADGWEYGDKFTLTFDKSEG
jgi:hypothetical protein